MKTIDEAIAFLNSMREAAPDQRENLLAAVEMLSNCYGEQRTCSILASCVYWNEDRIAVFGINLSEADMPFVNRLTSEAVGDAMSNLQTPVQGVH